MLAELHYSIVVLMCVCVLYILAVCVRRLAARHYQAQDENGGLSTRRARRGIDRHRSQGGAQGSCINFRAAHMRNIQRIHQRTRKYVGAHSTDDDGCWQRASIKL